MLLFGRVGADLERRIMLLAQTLLNIPGLHWETAVPLAIGVAVSGAALLVGRIFLVRRRRSIDKNIDAAAEGEYDPFVEGSKTERRSSIRRRGNPVAVLIGDSKGEAELAR